jgi:hypothetical protein
MSSQQSYRRTNSTPTCIVYTGQLYDAYGWALIGRRNGDARIIVLHNESVESELVHSLVPDRLAVNTEAMLK